MERYGIVYMRDNVEPSKRLKIVRRRDNSWEIWKGLNARNGRRWYLKATLRQHPWEMPKWSCKGGLIPQDIWTYVITLLM